MNRPKLASVLAFAALVVPMVPAHSTPSGESTAPVLTEIHDHLRKAQICIDEGTFALAAAHADAVLVKDDFTYAVKWEGVAEGLKPRAKEALSQGLENWRTGLKNSVSFTEITDAAKADVVIRFKPDVRMDGEPVAGYANWRRVIDQAPNGTVTTRVTADLQIRLLTPAKRTMSKEAVRHEIMHEMGHVLGLEDTDDIGNIMGPLDVDHPAAGPKAHEIQAVWDIRTQAKKIRLQAKAQVLKR